MPRFRIIFDEKEKGFLTNSDASAHRVDFVDADSIEDVEAALYLKIKKSDRRQISSKDFKIKSIEESHIVEE